MNRLLSTFARGQELFAQEKFCSRHRQEDNLEFTFNPNNTLSYIDYDIVPVDDELNRFDKFELSTVTYHPLVRSLRASYRDRGGKVIVRKFMEIIIHCLVALIFINFNTPQENISY